MNGVLAWTMAFAHLSLIVFLIVGAWLTRRWPGVRRVHLAAIAATAAVFLAGADCPLTVWENHFREAAGWSTYGDGFVVHHLIEPLTGVGRLGTTGEALVVAAWVLPTVVGYRVASRGTNS
jgi:signal transduction histidine kinase